MTDKKPEWKRGDVAYRSTPDTLKGGKWYYKAHGPFKLMGIIDGYAMVRFPRCMPFTVAVSNLRKTAEECVYVK
jgi:hypothetical protein